MKKKAFVALITLIILFANHNITAGMPSDDVCKDALAKCLIDAGFAGAISSVTGSFFGGLIVISAYASWCLTGYDWCIKYYIK